MTNHNRIELARQEYQDLPIPDELEFVVKSSIKKAKRNKRRKKLEIAVAVLAMVLLINTNKSFAAMAAEIPVLGYIVKAVDFRNYVDQKKDGTMEADIKQPYVTIKNKDGFKNAREVETKLNLEIEDYINEIISDYERDREETIEEGNRVYTNHEKVTTSYNVVRDTSKLYSIRLDTTIIMASSNNFSKIFHVDKERGMIIALKDLFKEGADYQKVITRSIQKQMIEKMEKDETIHYNLDEEDPFSFKTIGKDENFYINDKNQLVIVFDKYEVAPGYMGSQEFEIPREDLEGIMKKEYFQ